MEEAIKRNIPPGLAWGLLCVLSAFADFYGFHNAAIFVQNPEAAQFVSTILTSLLAILAGISRGYHNRRHKDDVV
jgi:hypothetical protein